MPTIHLSEHAIAAMNEVIAHVWKKEAIEITRSQAVLKLHVAWKGAKQ